MRLQHGITDIWVQNDLPFSSSQLFQWNSIHLGQTYYVFFSYNVIRTPLASLCINAIKYRCTAIFFHKTKHTFKCSTWYNSWNDFTHKYMFNKKRADFVATFTGCVYSLGHSNGMMFMKICQQIYKCQQCITEQVLLCYGDIDRIFIYTFSIQHTVNWPKTKFWLGYCKFPHRPL